MAAVHRTVLSLYEKTEKDELPLRRSRPAPQDTSVVRVGCQCAVKKKVVVRRVPDSREAAPVVGSVNATSVYLRWE
jgi:hypothetical protein